MMQRSRLSNIAFYVCSCGEIVILAIIVGILFGLDVRASEANNNWGLSVLIAFGTGAWLLLAIPWFVLEKRRPGQPIPPNMSIVTAGFWQLYRAITQIWRLKQSLLYLIGKPTHVPIEVTTSLTSNSKATSSSATLSTRPSPSSQPCRTQSSHTTLSPLPISS